MHAGSGHREKLVKREGPASQEEMRVLWKSGSLATRDSIQLWPLDVPIFVARSTLLAAE